MFRFTFIKYLKKLLLHAMKTPKIRKKILTANPPLQKNY